MYNMKSLLVDLKEWYFGFIPHPGVPVENKGLSFWLGCPILKMVHVILVATGILGVDPNDTSLYMDFILWAL